MFVLNYYDVFCITYSRTHSYLKSVTYFITKDTHKQEN